MKPKTFREGILAMPQFFDPAESRELKATIQFKVTGHEHGLWHFIIEEGQCSLREGEAQMPATLTITTPSEIWLKIMRDELNGPEAFLTGQASASGDMALLLKLGKLFSKY